MRPSMSTVPVAVAALVVLPACASAQAIARAILPRPASLGVWGVVGVGITSHDFRDRDGEYVSSGGHVGTSVSMAGGVRVRRVVIGVLHREWQGLLDWEYAGRGRATAVIVGGALGDGGLAVVTPYAGIGRAEYRREVTSDYTRHGASPALFGGFGIAFLPRHSMSPHVTFDRHGWLRGGRSGPLGSGYATSNTFTIGLTFH